MMPTRETLAVAIYRAEHPESRAVDCTTWYGSGPGVRRATCIFCRRVVATCSGRYPETKRALTQRLDHGKRCARRYLASRRAIRLSRERYQ